MTARLMRCITTLPKNILSLDFVPTMLSDQVQAAVKSLFFHVLIHSHGHFRLFECRIVGVARGSAAVECGFVRCIEWSTKRQALRQIGIGNKGASKSDEVCCSSRDRFLRAIGGESPRHDQRPGKQRTK